MAKVGYNKLGAFSRPSAYEQAVMARAKRREANQAFAARSNALAAGLATAATNKIQGLGDLAARAAKARLDRKV